MARPPKARRTNRKTATKCPKVIFYLFCEGENTEPNYLEKFAKEHGNQLVKVKTFKKQGVPDTVVKNAIKEKEYLTKKSKRDEGSLGQNDVFAAIVDVDQHPKIPQAKNLAQNNGILLIISNPCFEIWGLWHVCNHAQSIHRHDLQKRLSKEMSGYDHKNEALFNYSMMTGRYEQAKKRARHLEKQHQTGKTLFPHNNPSSNVYTLLDQIIKHGKGTNSASSHS